MVRLYIPLTINSTRPPLPTTYGIHTVSAFFRRDGVSIFSLVDYVASNCADTRLRGLLQTAPHYDMDNMFCCRLLLLLLVVSVT